MPESVLAVVVAGVLVVVVVGFGCVEDDEPDEPPEADLTAADAAFLNASFKAFQADGVTVDGFVGMTMPDGS